MRVTDHIKENALGIDVTYRLYESEVKSDYYLIFLHGKGEIGPLDGSSLNKVEIHGYPKHAKNGYEFPFNIIAPQVTSSHKYIVKALPAYIMLKYKAKAIIVTGLSLGGFGTYDAKLMDQFELIHAIAPVCGAGNRKITESYPPMNAWHFHGKEDDTVSWNTARAFIEGYNLLHAQKPIKVTLYPDVKHNAWDKAYSVSPGQDELLKWIIQQFNEAPKLGASDEEMKRNVQTFLQYFESAKNTLDQAAFHLQESINK